MLDAWHLTWIVPAVAALSFCFGAMLATGKEPAPPRDSVKPDECICRHCPINPRECGAKNN